MKSFNIIFFLQPIPRQNYNFRTLQNVWGLKSAKQSLIPGYLKVKIIKNILQVKNFVNNFINNYFKDFPCLKIINVEKKPI